MQFSKTKFLLSASSLANLPPSRLEIAFVGRSNSGKSSAINAIIGNKLAKTSRLPGRTRLINFFTVAEGKLFVDLPGYGYAKVARDTKREWEKLLAKYFAKRQELTTIVITMDIRHPLREGDLNMLEWVTANNLTCYILLTKSDKLSKSRKLQAVQKIQNELQANFPAGDITLQTFSATNKEGVEPARDFLAACLQLG